VTIGRQRPVRIAKRARPRVRTRPQRVFWHDLFGVVLTHFWPSVFEIHSEFRLAKQPQRVDFLLLRRRKARRATRPGVLRGLWPLVSRCRAIIAEFKSIVRPFAAGDLHRLLGYGGQYVAAAARVLRSRRDFALVLLLPSPSPALATELAWLRLTLQPISPGYWRVPECPYPLIVAFLDHVSDAERDDLIGCFGHRKISRPETASWLVTTGGLETETAMARIRGYNEVEFAEKMAANKKMSARLLRAMSAKDRLAGLPAKDRLAGLPAKDRVAGLPAKDRVAGLSTKELAAVLSSKELAALVREKKKSRPGASTPRS